MWVFGYGSLMWDGWEKQFNCLQRQLARLHGYRRSFSKASVKNWGSPAHPGPTLNIEAKPQAICTGIAFEFPPEQCDNVSAYLARREGKGFSLTKVPVTIEGGQAATALVPIYKGPNIVDAASVTDLARLVAAAKGTSGMCRDDVRGIQLELDKLGISDPAVSDTWDAVLLIEQ
jgi:cation transport protein ChaC